ncbi:MAG: polyphosphate polymerase domain-containing protein [Lachnospiraceae bacterium]|nr:polyphosphate polymerase domain-containing protein [Lachnospiraceae bacterium]
MGKETAFRCEDKYLISEDAAKGLKDSASRFFKLDSHVGEEGFYDIRSLYFDTPDDRFYHEKIDKVHVRHKWRVRIYDGNTRKILLEKKESIDKLKHKTFCKITRKQCEALIYGTEIDTKNPDPVFLEFLKEAREIDLKPKVIVDYRRVPFVYKENNVRITFDMNIAGTKDIDTFLLEEPYLTRVIPDGMMVLEVKYEGRLPEYVKESLKEIGELKKGSYSKYVEVFSKCL